MGFKFRKRIKIAPGVSINLGKKGTSVSVGGKGFTQTFSSTGKVTSTVGIPGSGISHSSTINLAKSTDTESKPKPAPTTAPTQAPQKVRDLEHLDENGELPLGWLYANKSLIEPAKMICTYLLEKYIEEKNKGVLAKYAARKAYVLYLVDLQKSCESKGECFAKWFDDLVCDKSSLDSYIAEVKDMEDNIEELLKKEKLIAQLKSDLLEIVKAEPGVVQSDLYKRFDPELKPEISEQLYWLSRNGVITREKSGRSYKLFPVTGEVDI